MDTLPFTTLLGIVCMMSLCDAVSTFSGSGNYWYICNRANDKCLASSPSDDKVYVKSVDFHWEEQPNFVWIVTKSSNEYRFESAGKRYDERKYLSTDSDGDYVDLNTFSGDKQRWNIEKKGSQNDYAFYHIYNEDLYKDPDACWFWCTPAHLYANGNNADLKIPEHLEAEHWYFVPVDPYDNLGMDPGSSTMTQCQGDCDNDDDCKNGYDCYYRDYNKCKKDCEMPEECFIKPGETSNAGPGAWDMCISNTVPVMLPFEAPQPSDGGKYYFVFDSKWVAAVAVVLTVVNLVIISVWCTRSRTCRTKKVAYEMVDVESEAEDLK